MRATKTTTSTPTLASLHGGLSGRPRPEDVLGALRILNPTAPSWRQRLFAGIGRASTYSYLPTEFEPVSSATGPAAVLAVLLGIDLPSGAGCDPNATRALLATARERLSLVEGRTNFKQDRENREARRVRGLDLSRRRYDKLFRLVGRLEDYLAKQAEQQALLDLIRFAKTSFAAEISLERFAKSPASAAFVAYYAANLGRRNLFITGPQARAFDEVAEKFLAECERSDDTDWYAVAHVYPRADVLARLTVEELVALLERSLAILEESAARLEVVATRDNLDLEHMIVGAGNDSSTWNALAGAWNRARDFWIALVYALGQETFFDGFLPGKVLRLMAADVAAWHRMEGATVHDDTSVWAALPKPWDVLAGRAGCGRSDVETACRHFGIDPEKTGWTAPRPRTAVDTWRPTPESVHGVVVNHPELALLLRKIGAFSGKSIRLEPVD